MIDERDIQDGVTGAQWFCRGVASIATSVAAVAVDMTAPPIWSLRRDERRVGIVLDDDSPMVGYMHRKKLPSGLWRVIPCNAHGQGDSANECRLCKGKGDDEHTRRAALTVYAKTADGWRRELLLASGEMASFLAAERANYGTLRGLLFEAVQVGDPGFGLCIGSKFRVLDVRVVPSDLQPFYYEGFIVQMSNDDMKSLQIEVRKSRQADKASAAEPRSADDTKHLF